jgi:hypothetical protein
MRNIKTTAIFRYHPKPPKLQGLDSATRNEQSFEKWIENRDVKTQAVPEQGYQTMAGTVTIRGNI